MPGAPIRRLIAGAVDPADVFDLGPGDGSMTPDRNDGCGRSTSPASRTSPSAVPSRRQIDSVVLRHDQPVAWCSLQRWLESMLSLRGDGMLRLKGLVWLQGEIASDRAAGRAPRAASTGASGA